MEEESENIQFNFKQYNPVLSYKKRHINYLKLPSISLLLSKLQDINKNPEINSNNNIM